MYVESYSISEIAGIINVYLYRKREYRTEYKI